MVYDSWDVSGAMENVWDGESIFTLPPSSTEYEPGLIARLLGVVLEAVNAYGVRLLRI